MRNPFFYVIVFLLTHLVSTTHPLFQATDNMSSSTGAEDSRAGGPPGRIPGQGSKCCVSEGKTQLDISCFVLSLLLFLIEFL